MNRLNRTKRFDAASSFPAIRVERTSLMVLAALAGVGIGYYSRLLTTGQEPE
jgi:hypothetical protein